MLERDVLATIPVDRHALLVAAVQVLPGSDLDGAPLRVRTGRTSSRVIGMSAAGAEWVDWNADRGAGCCPRVTWSWWWPAAAGCVPCWSRRRRPLEQPRLDAAGQ